MVRLVEKVVDYINSRNAPVTRTELEKVFKLKENTISDKVAPILKNDIAVQRVRTGENNRTMEVFISKKLKESYGNSFMPRSTAKGLCRIDQDLYPGICSAYCYSFISCAKDFRDYCENNKIPFPYDVPSSIMRRIGKVVKPARYSTSER